MCDKQTITDTHSFQLLVINLPHYQPESFSRLILLRQFSVINIFVCLTQKNRELEYVINRLY